MALTVSITHKSIYLKHCTTELMLMLRLHLWFWGNRVSLCNLDSHGTRSVDQYGLELRDFCHLSAGIKGTHYFARLNPQTLKAICYQYTYMDQNH